MNWRLLAACLVLLGVFRKRYRIDDSDQLFPYGLATGVLTLVILTASFHHIYFELDGVQAAGYLGLYLVVWLFLVIGLLCATCTCCGVKHMRANAMSVSPPT